MKAITTTYHGPTQTRGARVIADDGDGNRVSVAYDGGLHDGDTHATAARALCDKMHWGGRMLGGQTKRGWVWVFEDTRHAFEAGTFETKGETKGRGQGRRK